MTICKGCAKKVVGEAALHQPIPKTCLRCFKPLPDVNRKVKPHLVQRWMCPDCIEFVLERPTDACFVCGRPMTHRGFVKLRQTQKDPHERPAYREFVQGRKLT